MANILRRSNKPVLLVVNKLDNPNDTNAMWEFMQLGLGEPWPVSALHGTGTGDLLDEVVQRFPEPTEEEHDELDAINVAIIGRPNAGKSSLTNKLTNNDRSIVSDVAGTTRDAIDTTIEHEGRYYTIIDTAGLRRKSVIDEDVEYYGYVRALRAIDRAEVVLLVIDGTIGLTDQDQRVAGMAAERGCAMVIILNKWDLSKVLKLRQRSASASRIVSCSWGMRRSSPSRRFQARTFIVSGMRLILPTTTTARPSRPRSIQQLVAGDRDFGHTISGRARSS